jgi:hypothetical protein
MIWEQSLVISRPFLATSLGALVVTGLVSLAMFLYLRSGQLHSDAAVQAVQRFQYRLAVVLCLFLFLLGSYAVFWDPLGGRVVHLRYEVMDNQPMMTARFFLIPGEEQRSLHEVQRMQYVWKARFKTLEPTYQCEFYFEDGTVWVTAPLSQQQVRVLDRLLWEIIPRVRGNEPDLEELDS